jgi:putative sigma-54 modulation protein
MKLTVTGRRPGLAEAARTELERKLQRLERVLGGNALGAQAVVGEERGQVTCELTVHVRGDHVLHGLGRGSTLPVAGATAVQKIEQQAKKLTDRWKTRRRNGSARSIESTETPAARVNDGTPRVIRSRAAALKPMTVDDAVIELVSGARPVLVFRDAESDGVTVLFRRPDGHFGLIEPDR